MNQLDDEIRFLSSETLTSYWEALLKELRGFTHVSHNLPALPADGELRFTVTGKEGDLPRLDNAVMHCPILDPLYRDGRDGRYTVVANLRRWWRKSVPFLLDPEGDRRYYNYVIEEADQAPGT